MECSQFRQSLDLADAIDSADPLFQATRQHVDNCSLCAQKLSKRLEVERSIKFTMDSMAQVPETLVSSVIATTRNTKPHSNPWRSFVTTAASMTLAVGISVFGFSLWGEYQRSVAVEKLCVLSIRNHELDNKPEYVLIDVTIV